MSDYVYVAVNDAYPDMVKVGWSKDPEARSAALSSPTGVPGTFSVFHKEEARNAIQAERRVHEMLARKRINPQREFFSCTPTEAREAIIQSIREIDRMSWAYDDDGARQAAQSLVDMPFVRCNWLDRAANLTWGVAEITPDVASRLLGDHAPAHGSPIDSKISEMMGVMSRGEWKLNGVALIFNVDGALMDGRKRLEAIARGTTTLLMMVVVGISPTAGVTLNTEKTRTAGDILSIGSRDEGVSGTTQARTIAVIANMCSGRMATKPLSKQQTVEFVRYNPRLIEIIADTTRRMLDFQFNRVLMLSACRFLFDRVDEARSRDFFDILASQGEGASEKKDASPPEVLRRILLADLDELPSKRMSTQKAMAVCLLAWDAWMSGRKPKQFNWRADGSTFPAVRGWAEGDVIPFPVARSGRKGEGDSDWTKMSVSIVLLSPDDAKEMLNRNTNNRNLSRRVVVRHKRDMEAGFWKLNGESIKFAGDGEDAVLLDGQHRLRAVIDSKKTVPMIVVTGLNGEVFDTYDVGNRRNFAETLKAEGIKDPGNVSATLSLLWHCDQPEAREDNPPTHSEKMDAFEHNRDILEALHYGRKLNAEKLVARPIGAVAGYMLCRATPERKDMIDTFFQNVGDGCNLPKEHPAFVLREMLRSFPKDARGSNRVMVYIRLVDSLIRSWNLNVQRKPARKVDFRFLPEGSIEQITRILGDEEMD